MKGNCRFAMAVHVLAVLAYCDGDPVSSQALSASVNTNPVIVRRLLLALKAARLVETRKGPHAGSRLSRSPGRISLVEVYRAVSCGHHFVLPSRKPNSDCPIGRSIQAALKGVFVAAQTALERELGQSTLAGVLEMMPLPAGRRSRPQSVKR